MQLNLFIQHLLVPNVCLSAGKASGFGLWRNPLRENYFWFELMKLAYWNGEWGMIKKGNILYHDNNKVLLQLWLNLVKELHASSWMDIFIFHLWLSPPQHKTPVPISISEKKAFLFRSKNHF